MTTGLVYAVGTLLTWLGWIFAARVVYLGLQWLLNPSDPDRPRLLRGIGVGALVGAIGLAIGAGMPVVIKQQASAGVRLPLVWFVMPYTAWLSILCLAFIVARAIQAVATALAEGVPGVLGIHLEGPFLSPARKGVHNAEKFRRIDARALELLTSLKNAKTLVTLAPEMTTPEMIARLTEAGVIVAAGHTNATYDDILAAYAQGLTGFTHLFNAMSPLTGREPGVVGAALSNPETYCGIIVDARHVHPETLKLALRCKPHDRFMLVTDGLANVGTNAESFKLLNATIRIENGVYVDENGTLAGSALDMRQAVRNAMTYLGVELCDALNMASAAPAQFLGLGHEYGTIAKGFRANFVVADDDLNIRETWIDGAPG